MNAFLVNAVVSFLAAMVLHEFGHYVAARICGVPVKQAGFGWGPRLFGVKVSDVDCQSLTRFQSVVLEPRRRAQERVGGA